MIRHVMSDGTRRDSIEGYILPKEISKSLIDILKEIKNGNSNKTRTIREK